MKNKQDKILKIELPYSKLYDKDFSIKDCSIKHEGENKLITPSKVTSKNSKNLNASLLSSKLVDPTFMKKKHLNFIVEEDYGIPISKK